MQVSSSWLRPRGSAGAGAVPICTRARPPPLHTLRPPYPFLLRSPVPWARLCGGLGWDGRPPGTLRGDRDGLGAPGRSSAGARPPPLGISAGCFLSAPARRPGGGRASAVSRGALPGAGVDGSAPLGPGPGKLVFLAPTSWASTKPPITGRAPLQPAGSRLELGVGGGCSSCLLLWGCPAPDPHLSATPASSLSAPSSNPT